MKKFLPTSKGFTLIELMVVVTIIAFLSVIGIVAFGNAQKQARDGRRRGDIDAIAVALEAQRNQLTGVYPLLTDSMFAKNVKPKDPSTDLDYTVTRSADNTKFVVCTDLEIDTGNSTSGTALALPATANTGGFYCRGSQQ